MVHNFSILFIFYYFEMYQMDYIIVQVFAPLIFGVKTFALYPTPYVDGVNVDRIPYSNTIWNSAREYIHIHKARAEYAFFNW
jgi:hypothetical protein